ncbi:MAG TPA: hypothetical protein VKV95_03000 [Terriglobia bacterium]|nr:hypothetical protein [Terriglobia bacterium]
MRIFLLHSPNHSIAQFNTMSSTLQQILLVVGILGVSAVITNLFARAMYITCSKCGTLNARRRTACRNCGKSLRENNSPA